MIYLVIFLIAIIAFTLSAICGGGASFLLLPLLGMIMPGAQVPAAISIGTSASSISRIIAFNKRVRWNIVVWFVPPALPAVWFGARLLSGMNPVWLELLIGIFLISNLPFIFKGQSSTYPERNKWWLLLIGMATGFISGLTGAVGLLFNRFYLTYGLTKEEVIATRAANELLLHLIKIILYALFGLLTVQSITVGLVISIAAIISTWSMKRLLVHFTENRFKRIGFTAMVFSGAFMLFNSVYSLYHKEDLRLTANTISKGIETKIKWKQASFALEFEYNEGFEIERSITLKDLPIAYKQNVARLVGEARIILIEEVYGWGAHSYEVYLIRNGKLEKYDLK